MARAIMAAVGILVIYLGGSWLGVLLLLPAIITIIVAISKWINKRNKYKRYEEERLAQALEEKRLKEVGHREAIQKQQDLIEQYKNGSLVKEIIDVICDGSPRINVPEKIIIYTNCVQGIRGGNTITYDFSANRVHSFFPVIKSVFDEEELNYLVRPQIAMAEALNSLLGNEFEIYDAANRELNFHTDSDGDSYTTTTYISDHVTMSLKSTLPNRSF